MSLIKFTSNNDYDFDCESVSLLRDVSKDLIKRASSKELFKNIKKTKDQEDLHVIAIGAHNKWPQNRNGDIFLTDDCKKYHTDFVKADRAVNKHHKNKPTDPKYGNIKASAFNDPMDRIELILGIDKKAGADILHEQETTGNTNWSMAAKIAADECTWCHHFAKDENSRCEHIPKNLGEMNEAGVKCAMINSPRPKWFELSHVRRPADHIGQSLGKIASINSILKSAYPSVNLLDYPDLVVPQDDFLISKKASDKRELLAKLSEMEKRVEAIANSTPQTNKEKYIKQHAHKINKTPPIDNTTMAELRKMDPQAVLKCLADNGIVLSSSDFASYLFDNKIDRKHIDGMRSHLPHIYNKLEEDGGDKAVNTETFDPEHIGKIPNELKHMIGGLREGHSLEEGPALRRIMIISISSNLKPNKEEPTKEAGHKELAAKYASYQLSALEQMNESGKLTEDILLNTVLMNR